MRRLEDALLLNPFHELTVEALRARRAKSASLSFASFSLSSTCLVFAEPINMVKGHLDGNIELIYSDGETVTIDKELLRSNSTVFAGMLEGAQGEKCTVAETETEVLQLVGLMLGEKFVANGDDWLCLVKIADKYDMPLVQSRLENVCW